MKTPIEVKNGKCISWIRKYEVAIILVLVNDHWLSLFWTTNPFDVAEEK